MMVSEAILIKYCQRLGRVEAVAELALDHLRGEPHALSKARLIETIERVLTKDHADAQS
jgi:hypothetical protein